MSTEVHKTPLDLAPHLDSILKTQVNYNAIVASVDNLIEDWKVIQGENYLAWTIKALTLTDLTTLAGDDTASNVHRLCYRASFPLPDSVFERLQIEKEFRALIHTAAVCVYPSRVADAFHSLKELKMLGKVNIASVATGFPSGSYPLASRLAEITYAIEQGANEIDIVIDRSLVLTGQWQTLYDELVAMRQACGTKAHLKAILGIGECGTFQNVYRASMIAMFAGSDFIKTSTGKEAVNATLPVGLVMIRAIQDFEAMTGRKIGLKPAGGVKKVDDAIKWMVMIKKTLGNEWLTPEMFRFGASGLLDDIEKQFL
ncbi:deoxyribose-phosphate aldolase [Culicoides brevitarsis]|uniref:deoxyribose-phosphate aldolase n=1 Tax=Culicoides brevitarsis TaxID=469753 RepID=UPI00307BBE16